MVVAAAGVVVHLVGVATDVGLKTAAGQRVVATAGIVGHRNGVAERRCLSVVRPSTRYAWGRARSAC